SQPPLKGRGDAVSGTRNALHHFSSAARIPSVPSWGPDKRPSEPSLKHSPPAMGKISKRPSMLRPPTAATPAPLSRSPGYAAGYFSTRVSGSRSAENERTVGATEPEGVGQDVLERHLPRCVGNVVEIAALARGV